MAITLFIVGAAVAAEGGAMSRPSATATPTPVASILRASHSSANDRLAREPDTAAVHRRLRSRIAQFEDYWRARWKERQSELHGPLRAGASSASDPMTRRATALRCYVNDNPPIVSARSAVVNRPVVTRPRYTSVCPGWFPPGQAEAPDEAESIDFALGASDVREVRFRRDALIRELEAALRSDPEDIWISGQLVRFLIDQRSLAQARAVAMECRSDREFCTALVGLVYAEQGALVAADSAFALVEALGAARHRANPLAIAVDTSSVDSADVADSLVHVAASDARSDIEGKQRPCLDGDVMSLFDRVQERQLLSLSCDEQQTRIARMWWLADPLWSTLGNERLVAHGARRIHATLRSVADRDERYVWSRHGGGLSMRATVIRYGWPSHTYYPGFKVEENMARGIERRPPARLVFFPFTTKEYFVGRTALMPKMDALEFPYDVGMHQFDLYAPPGKDIENFDAWWPFEHMPLATQIMPLDSGQHVYWRRDSSVAFHLAIDSPLRNSTGAPDSATADSATGDAEYQAFLMGGTSASDTRGLSVTSVRNGGTIRFESSDIAVPHVLSAELYESPTRAWRLRFGTRPPSPLGTMPRGELALSVPAFVRLTSRGAAVPFEPAEVAESLMGSLTFAPTDPVAIYWESYGFIPGDTVSVELQVRRDDDRSVGRVLGSTLGVMSDLRDSLSIRWTEPDAGRASKTLSASVPTVGRSVSLDFSALPPGRYKVIVRMRTRRGDSAQSEQVITLRQ